MDGNLKLYTRSTNIFQTINNQTKAIKSSQVYTVLCELNDTCHFEPNKSQTFSTTININTKLTTYNIPKIRLLEMMKSYSYNKKY